MFKIIVSKIFSCKLLAYASESSTKLKYARGMQIAYANLYLTVKLIFFSKFYLQIPVFQIIIKFTLPHQQRR